MFVRDYTESYAIDPRIDSQGFLRTTAKFARAGVQEYYGDNGELIREFRPASEVAKSVEGLSLQVVTLDHTDVPVTVDNRHRHDRGTTGQLEFRDGWIQGEIVIRDPVAIEKAMTTHRELSVGYHADVEDTPGIFVDIHGWQGPPGRVYPYDRVQRNIRPNHQAIVEAARAGHKARLDNTAHNDGCGCDSCRSKEDRPLKKLTIGDKDYEVPDEVADAFAKVKGKADSVDALKLDNRELKTKVTVYEALGRKADGVTAPSRSDSEFEKEFKARHDAYQAAVPFLGDAQFDAGLSSDQWKVRALQAACPGMSLDGLSVDTAFQMLQLQNPAPAEPDYLGQFTGMVADDRQGQFTAANRVNHDKAYADASAKEMTRLRNSTTSFWEQ